MAHSVLIDCLELEPKNTPRLRPGPSITTGPQFAGIVPDVFHDAVIVACPALCGVTCPPDTVAIELLLLSQDAAQSASNSSGEVIILIGNMLKSNGHPSGNAR